MQLYLDVYRVYFAQFIENLTIFVEHNPQKKMLHDANHTLLESPFSFYPSNNYALNIPS